MRLVCPNCEAKYEVPEDAIPETGRDVQCANCGHAWYQMRPRAGGAEPAVPPVVPPAAVEESVPEPAPVIEPEPEPAAEVVAEVVAEVPVVAEDVVAEVASEPSVAAEEVAPETVEAEFAQGELEARTLGSREWERRIARSRATQAIVGSTGECRE